MNKKIVRKSLKSIIQELKDEIRKIQKEERGCFEYFSFRNPFSFLVVSAKSFVSTNFPSTCMKSRFVDNCCWNPIWNYSTTNYESWRCDENFGAAYEERRDHGWYCAILFNAISHIANIISVVSKYLKLAEFFNVSRGFNPVKPCKTFFSLDYHS